VSDVTLRLGSFVNRPSRSRGLRNLVRLFWPRAALSSYSFKIEGEFFGERIHSALSPPRPDAKPPRSSFVLVRHKTPSRQVKESQPRGEAFTFFGPPS